MIFIGLFGIQTKQKQLPSHTELTCQVCHNAHPLSLYKQHTEFQFFFIPVFKWHVTYYLSCEHCQSIYEVSNEDGISLEAGDVQLPPESLLRLTATQPNCQTCHRTLTSEFTYCPYCGTLQQ